MNKGKYLQIFNYLLEFSKLRSKPVRDIENAESQYPDIVWLNDIPQCEIFDCITFSTYNQDADYWLKINKPKAEPTQPIFPKLSDTLNDWIEKDSLIDENGIPVLKETILKNGQTILLSDNPQIQSEYQDYLNTKWIDDLEYYKIESKKYESQISEYKKQTDTYKHFFSIYNKAEQFGEEYELIVGIGLLYFKENENTPFICRHVLTSKAEISFEFSQRESFVKVSPSIENEIQIESDAIIDLFQQFDAANIIAAENKVAELLKEKNILDSPFDEQIKEAIQIFAERVRPDGQLKDDLSKPKTIPKTPTVFFSPALILRKRNTRSLTALYEKIISTLTNADDNIDIPSLNDLIGEIQQNNEISESSIDNKSNLLTDETIYFPKKYNDEQIEIIEKARRNNKVLVQGPPGTGKSHTIANLICHLLAHGKKVLVTAYTKRALEVLKNQMPPEFKNLTVNLLSGDSASLLELRSSVDGINDKLAEVTNLNNYKLTIKDQETKLSSIKEQKALTKNEWLKVKEKSIRKQTINKYYQGTLIEIAEKIEKELSIFCWFKDEVKDISKAELIADIENFIALTKYYQSIDCNSFNYIVPQKEKILSLSYLKEYRNITNDLLQKHNSENDHILISCKDFQELRKQLEALYKLLLEIENNSLPYKQKIINDYENNLNYWKEKLVQSGDILSELPDEKTKWFDRYVEIAYLDGKSLIKMKNDAQTLLSYLKAGNNLTGILFHLKKALLPKNIKEKLYFIEAIEINGSQCDTIEKFATVLKDIKIKQDIEELKRIWRILPSNDMRSYCDKANFYKQLKDRTETLISCIGEANKIRKQIESSSSLKFTKYDSEFLSKLIKESDYNFLLSRIKEIKENINKANKYLSIQNIHPIAKSLINDVEDIDPDRYEQQLTEIDTLITEQGKYTAYIKTKNDLQQHFPNLIDEIFKGIFDLSEIKQLEKAIYFKHASSEISKLLGEDYETKLINKLSKLDRQEEKLVSELAANKAWLSVLDGLSRNILLRQHLQAWVLAQNKIGKTGKGKRALKFRKEAQRQMEKCKDSIPCWIMPLYKVAETINPEYGMYDYVIIDEASQLGADAIFLLYVSKNIIIVGDDKQVAPEYIGVDSNTMAPHIERYLQNIPFANFYGTEFSFFDHATMFCTGSTTVLREHFRCMPEIIEFSNKHFYSPTGKGLYPLKQYSEKRLPPLRAFYCPNGYTDGTHQNITNKIEAECIADEIAKLINDENYYKVEEGVKTPKSIGVIALQGNKQAALIESSILKKISEAEYKKRNIVCGNSASFQGDERDIMFLSLITAIGHNRAPLVKDEDNRRFNVAASRAKEQAWLFHSVQLEDLSNTDDLRYKLLNHFINYKPQAIPSQRIVERSLGTQPDPFESWFEVDIYNDIVSNGYSVIPQYEVARGKYRIDLVALLPNGIKIAIECDGDKFHGAEQFQNDLMRQNVLERCGWQFFRVSGAEYYSNRKKALEPLWKLLKENYKEEEAYVKNNMNNIKQEINKKAFELKAQEVIMQFSPGNKKHQKELFTTRNQENIVQGDNNLKPTEEKANISNDSNFSEALIYTSAFNVYKVQKKEINNRLSMLENIDFEPGEKPIYITTTNNYSGYLVIAFENGKVAKITLKSYQTEYNRKKLKNAFNGESKIVFIEQIENDIDLVAVSSINKVVLFNTVQINPVESRTSKGVQVMKQKDGSKTVKVKKLNQVKFSDPEYYRKSECLNVVGYYLKSGDKI